MSCSRACKKIVRQYPGVAVGVYWFLSIVAMDYVNTFAYERVPEDLPPLPDLGFDLMPKPDWSVYPVDLVTTSLSAMGVIYGFLQGRKCFPSLRRLFFVYALLMNMRMCTIIVTTLPICYEHGPCREGHVPLRSRLLTTFAYAFAMGFQVPGVVQCGDYIFSGHTTFIWLLVLHVTYNIKMKGWCVSLLNLWGAFGSLCIIAFRHHYSIDVVLAFFITEITWRWYHTKVEALALSKRCDGLMDYIVRWVEQMDEMSDKQYQLSLMGASEERPVVVDTSITFNTIDCERQAEQV